MGQFTSKVSFEPCTGQLFLFPAPEGGGGTLETSLYNFKTAHAQATLLTITTTILKRIIERISTGALVQM